MWKHKNSCHFHTLWTKQNVNFGAGFLKMQTVISIKSGNMCSLFLNKCHEFHCCFQRSELVAKVNAPVQRSSAFLRYKFGDSAASRDCVVRVALAIEGFHDAVRTPYALRPGPPCWIFFGTTKYALISYLFYLRRSNLR